MIPIAIPIRIAPEAQPLLQEMLRRSVDGTILPLFVDYKNFRVGIGNTSPAYALDITGNLRCVGNFIFNGGTVLGVLSARNVDCQGQGTFAILGVTDRANIAELNVFKPSYFNNDISVVGGGNGVIIPTRNGQQKYRIIMENDGRISADLVP